MKMNNWLKSDKQKGAKIGGGVCAAKHTLKRIYPFKPPSRAGRLAGCVCKAWYVVRRDSQNADRKYTGSSDEASTHKHILKIILYKKKYNNTY